ncbi:MAG: hypothetical protein U9P70_03160 [Patescibacteria group bacterium]|nr:hypothetical protein [Patescibacteria group bacterium]
MSEIIIVKLLFVIGPIMLITMVVFLAGVWRNKKANYYKELMINNIICTTNFEKNKYGNLKGIYNNKKILIKFYLFDIYAMPENSFTINIETNFYDASKQAFVPKTYFILKQKESFFNLKKKSNVNSNDFENSFNVNNKYNLSFDNKIKQKLEILLKNKYFNAYTKLKVQSPSKSHVQNRGKVVFEKINSKISKNSDSLKMAMDIVVDIAKQMDEMKMGR